MFRDQPARRAGAGWREGVAVPPARKSVKQRQTGLIRQHAALTNLPVVILSSLSSEDDRRHGLDAGADAFVVKSSFDETALLEIVARMLGQDR